MWRGPGAGVFVRPGLMVNTPVGAAIVPQMQVVTDGAGPSPHVGAEGKAANTVRAASIPRDRIRAPPFAVRRRATPR